MPSEARHLRAAGANEELAVGLLDTSPAWAITLAFYAALHWVDAFLAKSSSVHPRSHDERDGYVARSQLRAIYDAYRILSTRSREARYDLLDFSADDAQELLRGELAEVKAHVQSLL